MAPSLNFQYNKGFDRLMISSSAYSQRPSAERMLPVLNIANPSRLTLGNVYLKPYSYNYFSANWTRNNREKFSNLMAYFSGQVNAKPITQAQWYDAGGILYSIPVNARKPSLSFSGFVNYNTPLDAKKNWFLTINGSISAAGREEKLVPDDQRIDQLQYFPQLPDPEVASGPGQGPFRLFCFPG